MYCGTGATSGFICYIDFGGDKASTAGSFTLRCHADGIVSLG